MNRPARAEKVGLSVPPAKKKMLNESASSQSTSSQPSSSTSSSSMADYNLHIGHLKKSYSSGKWSIASLSLALGETAIQRRHWISQANPSVKDILDKFPCLKEPKLVGAYSNCIVFTKLPFNGQMLKEFCSLTGCKEEEVPAQFDDMEERVLKYSAMENKKAVKTLLELYNSIKEKHPG